MSWEIKDEWIDLAQARHYVIFHNKGTTAEHHLIYEFKHPACPHCGHLHQTEEGETIDFQQLKDDTLALLQDHHRTVMSYREKHPNVRLGNGPK